MTKDNIKDCLENHIFSFGLLNPFVIINIKENNWVHYDKSKWTNEKILTCHYKFWGIFRCSITPDEGQWIRKWSCHYKDCCNSNPELNYYCYPAAHPRHMWISDAGPDICSCFGTFGSTGKPLWEICHGQHGGPRPLWSSSPCTSWRRGSNNW